MIGEYFIVKKDGKEWRTNRAGAYEMFDCLGRKDVTIEKHQSDGWVFVGEKMSRRTLKNGTIKYFFKGSYDYRKDTVYKDYNIEYNFYGHGEYSVQYIGEDYTFRTEEEAKQFIDNI